MTSHGVILPADGELALMKGALHITSFKYHPDVGGQADKYKICAEKTIELHIQPGIRDPDNDNLIFGKGTDDYPALMSRDSRIIFDHEQLDMICRKIIIQTACEVDDDGIIQDGDDLSPITMDGYGIHLASGQRVYVDGSAMNAITLHHELYWRDENEPRIKNPYEDAVSGRAVYDYIREITQYTIYWFDDQGQLTDDMTDQPVNGQAVYEAINERLGDLEGKNVADFVWEKLNDSINQINDRLNSIEDRLANIEVRLDSLS
jgi:tetrahydromethanopterin S-methyltransferase subunit G